MRKCTLRPLDIPNIYRWTKIERRAHSGEWKMDVQSTLRTVAPNRKFKYSERTRELSSIRFQRLKVSNSLFMIKPLSDFCGFSQR